MPQTTMTVSVKWFYPPSSLYLTELFSVFLMEKIGVGKSISPVNSDFRSYMEDL